MLMQELQSEAVQDKNKADECTEQFHQIDLKKQELNWAIDKNKAQIAKLTAFIEAKNTERDQVIDKIVEVQSDMGNMTEQRTEENTKYLADKEDDEKAIELLEQARDALQKYYTNHSIEMGPLQNFIQKGVARNATEAHKPQAKFSDKGARKNEAKGIVALLTNIIEDLQSELSTGKSSEEAAQVDYEKRMAIAEKLEQELNSTKTSLDTQIALREGQKDEEDDALEENEGLLGDQDTELSSIKPACDSILANLEERRRKRDIELDGLRTAKEYLAGASPQMAEMLQKRKNVQEAKMAGSSPRREGLRGIEFQAVSFFQARAGRRIVRRH